MEGVLWEALGRGLNLRPGTFRRPPLGVLLAEDLLRIRDKQGRMIALRANSAQKQFEENRSQKNIVLKARQMGLSTWIAGRFFLKTILIPGTMTVLVAHTMEATEGIFRVVQRMWEHLPAELQEGRARRSRANTRQMVFGAIDSEFQVISAASENAGRGLAIQNLHCSEVSRWPGDAAATLAGLKATLAPEGELVLESTPNGAHGCFYHEWSSARPNGAIQHFMPWWLEPSYRGAAVEASSLSEEESSLVKHAHLTLEQIGFRRGLEQTYRGLRMQEFAEDAVQCFIASGNCVFDLDSLASRLKEVNAPIATGRNGTLLLWFPPIVGRKYVVAADPAGGGSEGDFAAVQVIDVQTGMQCAELQQRLHARELADAIEALAREYNHAMVVVERNNHGAGVLAYLERRGLNLYESGGQTGWLTHTANRPEMIARMGVLLTERPEIFQSERLLEECRTFVTTRSGRPEAAQGAHDDCMMAMAIAQSVREEMQYASAVRGTR